MAQNFIACDREQELWLPPSLREWLPEEHLAWFVLDAVEEMDLAPFYGSYRHDGHGRAAPDPAMMVALFIYAYASGVRPHARSSVTAATTSRSGLSARTRRPTTRRSQGSGRGMRRRSAASSARCSSCVRGRGW